RFPAMNRAGAELGDLPFCVVVSEQYDLGATLARLVEPLLARVTDFAPLQQPTVEGRARYRRLVGRTDAAFGKRENGVWVVTVQEAVGDDAREQEAQRLRRLLRHAQIELGVRSCVDVGELNDETFGGRRVGHLTSLDEKARRS